MVDHLPREQPVRLVSVAVQGKIRMLGATSPVGNIAIYVREAKRLSIYIHGLPVFPIIACVSDVSGGVGRLF